MMALFFSKSGQLQDKKEFKIHMEEKRKSILLDRNKLELLLSRFPVRPCITLEYRKSRVKFQLSPNSSEKN